MIETKIIAVANQKGGVGKTTTAVNVAARLSNLGLKVLLLDLDAQGSLTASLGYEPSEIEVTISEIFEAIISRSILIDQTIEKAIIKINEGLFLIPSNITLSSIDNLLVSKTSREYVLKKIIGKIMNDNQERKYDYIIMDCPPTLSMISINALTACTGVLIPIKAQFLDFKGFNQLYDNIMLMKEETNENIKIEGAFLTMYDSRLNMAKKIENALHQIKENFGVKVFETKISQCTKAAEASYAGEDIFSFCPEGKTAKEYEQLVEELRNEG